MVREIIKKHLFPQREYIFGFADLHGLLASEFSEFSYGISIGKRLDDNIIDGIKNGPTIEYYNHYKHINKELADLTERIYTDFKKAGIGSYNIKPTVTVGEEEYNEEYLRTLTVDVSHKMVATRAGLGWIGKSDLFISRKFGPRLRLVSILLKQDPGIDTDPVRQSECGKCNICVVKCPAEAFNGKLWNTEVKREEFFNAHKCRKICNELARDRLNVDARICGMCVAVCPIGMGARVSRHNSF